MKKQTPAPNQPSDRAKLPSTKETRHSMAGKRHEQDMDRVHDEAHAKHQPSPDQDECFTLLKNDEEIPIKNPG